MNSLNIFNWLQEWYSQQCDGDWEHENGIKIETIDNPGWSVTIDLRGTVLEGLEIPYSVNEFTYNQWVGYSLSNNVFKGFGGKLSLIDILEVFKLLCLKYQKWH